ncbi:MAG: tRNA pseudouridine(38-40) synthase TruA [Spirochaetota bacterium]
MNSAARNMALEVAYDGTRYSGWQIQKNAATIQGVMEKKLQKVVKHPVRLRAAGRTDAGVHAVGQVASFHTASSMGPEQFKLALNSLLPWEIRVMNVWEASPGFHPRYHVYRRWYRYLISNTPEMVPFFVNYALWIKRGLDLNLLNEYCKKLIGSHDFTSFCTLAGEQNPVRRIFECRVSRKGGFVFFDVVGDSFLRKMVRTIVGTFLEFENAKHDPSRVGEILNLKDRTRAGQSIYPGGLYLLKVFF